MRQSDLSSSARSLSASMQATAPTAPTRVNTPTTADHAAFPALFGQVQTDVENFIQNGSSNADAMLGSGAMSTLSAEGQLYRERSQSTLSGGEGNVADGEAQQEFLATIAGPAQQAAQRLGVSPDLVAAHAALESGWGQHPLRQASGNNSNNLFALKASGNWQGDVAQSLTTEYENGSAVKKVQNFRSYPDTAGAFKDYAQLLLNNPRYRSALNAGNDAQAFAQGLARGGYATDPAYAGKLARVASQIQASRGNGGHGASAAASAGAAPASVAPAHAASAKTIQSGE